MCSPQFMRVFLLFVGTCTQRSLEFGGFVVVAWKATARHNFHQHSSCHDVSEMCSTQLKHSHVRNLDNNNPAPRVAPCVGLFDPNIIGPLNLCQRPADAVPGSSGAYYRLPVDTVDGDHVKSNGFEQIVYNVPMGYAVHTR